MKKGIAITCVDPRLHSLGHQLASLIGVDTVYNPRFGGPDGVMVDMALDIQRRAIAAEIQRFLGLGAAAIAFSGHTTCAGHPVDDDMHREHTCEGARCLRVDAQVPEEVPIHAFLAVRGKSDSDWEIEELGVF